MLFLNLNFADIAWVLNNLRDVRLVATSYLSCNTLRKIGEASHKPVLVENADTKAVGSTVVLDHAELAVDGPEDKEDDEHVVGVPETLVVGSAWLFDGGEDHSHKRNQHEVSRPARSSDEVGQDEANKTESFLSRQLRIVVPVRNGVDPGEEHDRPGEKLVEGDVLVKLNDTV